MLPSARRPKALEEEMAAERQKQVEKELREKLVFRTTKIDIFRKIMAEWYEGLSQKKKRTLTPKGLKRKAVSVCYANQIIYDNLPMDWLTELKTKHGLKLYEKKKKDKSRNQSFETEPSSSRHRSGDRRVSAEVGEAYRRSRAGLVTAQDVTPLSSKSTVPPSPSRPVKKFLDLTKSNVPPFWIKKECQGTVLPRVLSIYSTEDTNILFYDYNPKLKDQFGRILKLEPTPRLCEDFGDLAETVDTDNELGDD